MLRFKFAARVGYVVEEAETAEEAFEKIILIHDKHNFTDPIVNLNILEKKTVYKKLFPNDLYSPIYKQLDIVEKQVESDPEIIKKLDELEFLITNHAKQRLLQRFRKKLFTEQEIIDLIKKSKNTKVETISGLELWRFENFIFFLNFTEQNKITLVTVIAYRYFVQCEGGEEINLGIGKDINEALIHGSFERYFKSTQYRHYLFGEKNQQDPSR